jgi:hypothetical protein
MDHPPMPDAPDTLAAVRDATRLGEWLLARTTAVPISVDEAHAVGRALLAVARMYEALHTLCMAAVIQRTTPPTTPDTEML